MAMTSPHAETVQKLSESANGVILPLENGDRLTRAEFERRYQAMPAVNKAELIEGIVYMPSPVRHAAHSDPHSQIVGLLLFYRAHTPGVTTGDNGSIRLDLDNEPQPDAFLFIQSERGGQSRISQDDYLEGAPELIAEVASSSASYDLGDKLKAYRRNGVCEYLVWRVLDQELDWFVLRDDRFVPLEPDEHGIVRSQTFPGLWVDRKALLAGELTAVFDVLRRGLASPEHQAFVNRLEKASGN